MEKTFGGRLKSDLQSNRKRVIKGMAKKQIIRAKRRYCIRTLFRFIGSYLCLNPYSSNMASNLAFIVIRIYLTDNTQDSRGPRNNDQKSRDNAYSHARNNIHHNTHRDNMVHNTDRGLQSLRLGIQFDCHKPRRRNH